MAFNIGEEIVASYLQYIKGCDFIQQNLYTPDVQGEIDVVGIDLETKSIYVCEVAIHLVTGLQYTRGTHPNNVNKLTEKFSKDIEYTNKFFPDYNKVFMLWSPIVRKSGETAKSNQMADIEGIKANILTKYGVMINFVINEKFSECLAELRNYAKHETKEIKSPVIRYLQVEETLKRHNGKSKT